MLFLNAQLSVASKFHFIHMSTQLFFLALNSHQNQFYCLNLCGQCAQVVVWTILTDNELLFMDISE